MDFFRYRSIRRFQQDQQFGIGFSKEYLIEKRHVRPVVYFDSEANAILLNLCNQIIEDNFRIVDSNNKTKDLKEFFQRIKPFLFPLLENEDMQGFMWEREWRCPYKDGLVFSYNDIEIICCPSDERKAIEEILGDLIEKIEIVESWREYDDVTAYLKRRKKETNTEALNKIREIDSLPQLIQLKAQNEQTLNALSSYYGVFKETTDGLEARNINQTLADLRKKSEEINEQIKKVEEEIKLKEEQAKAKDKK